MLLCFCVCQLECCYWSHRCSDFFQKMISFISGHRCFSNIPEKFSAGQTWVTHSFTFNSWNLEITLERSSYALLTYVCTSRNYFGYFTFCKIRCSKRLLKNGQVTFATPNCGNMKSLVKDMEYWSIVIFMQMGAVCLQLRRTLQFFLCTHIELLPSFCEN